MNDRIEAVHKMKAYSDQLQAMFESGITPCGDFNPDFILGTNALKDQPFNIYPNPVSDMLRIEGTQPGDITTIIDMHGRELIRINASSNVTVLNTNEFAPGIYMAKIEGLNQTTTLKFSKE